MALILQLKVSQVQMDVYLVRCAIQRRGDGVAMNIFGNQDMQLFKSGVDYFK